MGYGYEFECEKCHYKFDVSLGSGASYPDVYQEVIRKIVAGYYGKRWSLIYERTPDAAIRANNYIYICDYCHHWICDKDVSLYVPKNRDLDSLPVLRNKYIVSDDNEIPYVPEDYIRSNYTTYRRFFYYCAKCGRRMHKAKDFEENGLSCPRCGEFNEAVSRFFWN